MLSFNQEHGHRIKLSNLGLSQRPDLVDGHTIHWHGFVNAIPLFDGVPELSISVPIGRNFTYFYRPHDPGTYMYHCHFEDVEHVQMGMTGHAVRPAACRTAAPPTAGLTKFAYNDGDGSTGYDREFGFMLDEIFAEGHYRDAHIQTTDWTDFKASFCALNGRTYPDTVKPNAPYDPLGTDGRGPPAATGRSQSSCSRPATRRTGAAASGQPRLPEPRDDGGQRPADRRRQGRRLLLKNGSVAHYIDTNSVDVGPGESRDVLFTAPASPAQREGGTGTTPTCSTTATPLRRQRRGRRGPGGMVTEMRVYPRGTASRPSQTPNA